MKKFVLLLLVAALSGCASVEFGSRQEQAQPLPKYRLLETVPELDGPAIPIAVYGFTDKTGQMKPND